MSDEEKDEEEEEEEDEKGEDNEDDGFFVGHGVLGKDEIHPGKTWFFPLGHRKMALCFPTSHK